jgi:outer membrane lipoprotein-sorting protein
MKPLFLAIFALFLSISAFSQYDPKALQTLEAMSNKYKAIPSFEADKFRLALPEQEVINNGSTIWTYLPEAKEVTIDNYDPSSEDIIPSKIYELYKKGFKYLYLQDKTEGGVMCEEIDLVPEKKDAQFFKIKMLISKKDKSLQSWTMFDKGGNRYKYTITKFNPNVKVEDSFFTFDLKKYPGVEPVDLR